MPRGFSSYYKESNETSVGIATGYKLYTETRRIASKFLRNSAGLGHCININNSNTKGKQNFVLCVHVTGMLNTNVKHEFDCLGFGLGLGL